MKVDYKALAKAMDMMLNPCFSPLTMKEMKEFIDTKDILVFSMSSLYELNGAYFDIAGNYRLIKHGTELPNIFSTIEEDDKIIHQKLLERKEAEIKEKELLNNNDQNNKKNSPVETKPKIKLKKPLEKDAIKKFREKVLAMRKNKLK